MRKIKPDLQAQPIGAVIEDYYDRHVGLGARPMVFIVNKRLKGDYYQIACYPGKTQVVINYLKDIQKKVYGTEDFKYSLLKERPANSHGICYFCMYWNYNNLSRIIRYFII